MNDRTLVPLHIYGPPRVCQERSFGDGQGGVSCRHISGLWLGAGGSRALMNSAHASLNSVTVSKTAVQNRLMACRSDLSCHHVHFAPSNCWRSLPRLRQLSPLTDDNLLIFRDRTPKGRHYTERPGGPPGRGFKTAASARSASAMPSRADAGVVRGPRSAGYGAPAPDGARRRSAHGGRPSGWRRTFRRWREG